jgi:putative ABC transport system permease protein
MVPLPQVTGTNNKNAGGTRLARAPISVIRVRITGVTGPDPASLNRIKMAAEQIEARTHLTVDIVADSSPAPTAIALPADTFGTPERPDPPGYPRTTFS